MLIKINMANKKFNPFLDLECGELDCVMQNGIELHSFKT